MVVVVVVDIYCIRSTCCCVVLQRLTGKNPTRYHVPEIINYPYQHHHLTISKSSSRSFLLVGVGVAVVLVAAADCGGGGDGRLYVAALFVIAVKFYLVRTWYQVVEGFRADAHR